jgi:hypothetical protein
MTLVGTTGLCLFAQWRHLGESPGWKVGEWSDVDAYRADYAALDGA